MQNDYLASSDTIPQATPEKRTGRKSMSRRSGQNGCIQEDGNWYVGRLPQVPGVFSQGATLDELERNIRDAYRLMLEEQSSPDATAVETREIEVLS